MTVSEALAKMHEVVSSAKAMLEGNGFEMRIETNFFDVMVRPLPDEKGARYATVALLINKPGGNEGEEYCLSLGVAILRNRANEKRLIGDIERYGMLVKDTVETLAGYEDKNEGFDYLVKKAAEEYEEFMERSKEQQQKSRKVTMIANAVLIGIFIIFIILMARR